MIGHSCTVVNFLREHSWKIIQNKFLNCTTENNNADIKTSNDSLKTDKKQHLTKVTELFEASSAQQK